MDVGFEFPEARGQRFGTVVESLGDPLARIVVEPAMYTSSGGVFWAAGSNTLATRMRGGVAPGRPRAPVSASLHLPSHHIRVLEDVDGDATYDRSTSPALFEPECRTPRQRQLANALRRFRELATLVPPGSEGAVR